MGQVWGILYHNYKNKEPLNLIIKAPIVPESRQYLLGGGRCGLLWFPGGPGGTCSGRRGGGPRGRSGRDCKDHHDGPGSLSLRGHLVLLSLYGDLCW